MILRSLWADLGLQTFTPRRLLRGTIPECLLHDYVFWHNADGSLSGYACAPLHSHQGGSWYGVLTSYG